MKSSINIDASQKLIANFYNYAALRIKETATTKQIIDSKFIFQDVLKKSTTGVWLKPASAKEKFWRRANRGALI